MVAYECAIVVFFFRNDDEYLSSPFSIKLKNSETNETNETRDGEVEFAVCLWPSTWPVFPLRFQLNVFIRFLFLHLLLNFFYIRG